MRLQRESGYSLIELVIVIVLGGIVAAMTSSILTLPINAYVDNTRRATLTDIADSALKRMQRDVREALPNSIRISNDGQTMELLHVIDGGRYRAQLASDGSGNILDFTQVDTQFDVLGSLQNFARVDTQNDYVAIYPVNSSLTSPYTGYNLRPLTNSSSANSISFTGFKFPLASPEQRFFIVDTPITYHCDLSAGSPSQKVLMRYQEYPIQAAQPSPPSSGGDIQANNISFCQFDYTSGSSSRSGLLTISIGITDDENESVELIQQIHVVNQP
jgi:MSHA biogenesis protein MshO